MSKLARKASERISIGIDHLQSGRVIQAKQFFRKFLKTDPDNLDGLVLLGTASNMSGHYAEAVRLFNRALAKNPNHLGATYNLGVALQALGQTQQALECYNKAVALAPHLIEAALNRAVVLLELGRFDEALVQLNEVRAFQPNLPEVHNQLGSLFLRQERWSDSEKSLGEALRLRADYPEAWNNLGVALLGQGRVEAAMKHFVEALTQQPLFIVARRNLARALYEVGRLDEGLAELRKLADLHPKDGAIQAELGSALLTANYLNEAVITLRRSISLSHLTPRVFRDLGRALALQKNFNKARECLEQALKLSDNDPEIYCVLAEVELLSGLPSSALDHAKKALMLRPELPAVHGCLGGAYQALGIHDKALISFEAATRLCPDELGMLSPMLFSLCYHDDKSLAQIEVANRRVQTLIAGTMQPKPSIRESLGKRPLKIGYISADLCNHSVARFLLPLLRHHDRDSFRIHLYSDVAYPDVVTHQFEALADHWRATATIVDERLAEIIAADGIDILVDLGGHTGANRLGLFNRRPAPVQLSWLGYGATTGLNAIDYYLCDAGLVPTDSTEWFAETLWRLPRCSFAFEPLPGCPDCTPLPALTQGRITFGSFNNAPKMTLATVKLWAAVLKAVSDSRLLLKTHQLADRGLCARLTAAFAEQGVGGERLLFRTHATSPHDHLATYGEVDIALDTTPYNGATTTCEALYMGVPVVSLSGNRLVSRYGATLLSAVGLKELSTSDKTMFVSTAESLAHDLTRLIELRGALRSRFVQSPLGDGAGLAEAIETSYRKMWKFACT